MKEKLIEQVLALLEQGKNFDLMEIELTKQYLKWALFLNVVGIVIGFVFLAFCVFLSKKSKKLDDEVDAIMLFVISVLIGFIGAGITIYSCIEMIKIAMFPKLFLVTNLLSATK